MPTQIDTQPVTGGARPVGQSQPAIEDHALIGDLYTAALVAKDGSIDFLCLPDFDSASCFTSLLGTPDNGRWKIAPTKPLRAVRRRYRGDSLVLETEQETEDGVVRLIDFMPVRHGAPRVVRIIEGVRGVVTMQFELHARFGYGLTVPRGSSRDSTSTAIAGPDALYLRGGRRGAPPFDTELTVRAGERVAYELAWARPYEDAPPPLDIDKASREELLEDGLVLRYRTDASDDGLQGKEGVFLACSFWLATAYQMMGRTEDAEMIFERASSVANDVGLLAEEYLTEEKVQTGNFPQAFSHLALVNAAYEIGAP